MDEIAILDKILDVLKDIRPQFYHVLNQKRPEIIEALEKLNPKERKVYMAGIALVVSNKDERKALLEMVRNAKQV
jgi:hypothetical protein